MQKSAKKKAVYRDELLKKIKYTDPIPLSQKTKNHYFQTSISRPTIQILWPIISAALNPESDTIDNSVALI